MPTDPHRVAVLPRPNEFRCAIAPSDAGSSFLFHCVVVSRPEGSYGQGDCAQWSAHRGDKKEAFSYPLGNGLTAVRHGCPAN